MRLYVDNKPYVCKDCLFYKVKLDFDTTVQPFEGMQGVGEKGIGRIITKLTNRCTLLDLAVATETANNTILGNCPLQVMPTHSNWRDPYTGGRGGSL